MGLSELLFGKAHECKKCGASFNHDSALCDSCMKKVKKKGKSHGSNGGRPASKVSPGDYN